MLIDDAERPRTDQPHYGAHLGDASYWGPFVRAALVASRLPTGAVEVPFIGTFPTFLVGELVVKFFGDGFDGAASRAAELAMHELLADHPEVPAPALVATGDLVPGDDGWSWPYLVTERLSGKSVRVLDRSRLALTSLPAKLGEVTAELHRLAPPAAVASRELVPVLRRSAPAHLLDCGLPAHLVEQVPEFLADAPAPSVLVHADITADHVFLDKGALEGIIDWGDAIVADCYYEFVAVYLDALAGSAELFRQFLDGYGLARDDRFSTRALQGVLEFQFDAISRVNELVNLDSVRDLDELAELLFTQ